VSKDRKVAAPDPALVLLLEGEGVVVGVTVVVDGTALEKEVGAGVVLDVLSTALVLLLEVDVTALEDNVRAGVVLDMLGTALVLLLEVDVTALLLEDVVGAGVVLDVPGAALVMLLEVEGTALLLEDKVGAGVVLDVLDTWQSAERIVYVSSRLKRKFIAGRHSPVSRHCPLPVHSVSLRQGALVFGE
jgi:hypothetical protein